MSLTTAMGGNVYSNSEYDMFTASRVRVETVRLWDWSTLRHRLARAEIASIGRAADVEPADCEAAMESEPLPLDTRILSAQQARAQKAQQVQALYVDKTRKEHAEKVIAMLQDGPMSIAKVSAALGIQPRAFRYLMPFIDGIRTLGRRADGEWIGLINQTLPKTMPTALSANALACYTSIRERGPTTTARLATILRMAKSSVNLALVSRRDVFVPVGRGKKGIVYGLVGIHDQGAK